MNLSYFRVLSPLMRRNPLKITPVDGAVFIFFAFSMSLPSGYSIGAALLLLLGLWAWPGVLAGRIRWSAPMVWWAAAIAVMGAAWAMHITDPNGALIMSTLGVDRVSKYVFVLLALPCLLAWRPARAPIVWGLVIGAIGAGATALWQALALHWLRADGYTNAIQFGNLSLLLAMWCLVWVWHVRCPVWRLALLVGFVAGLVASIASGTRGGWVTLPVLVFVVVWLGAARRGRTLWRGPVLATVGVVVVLCASLAALPSVNQRIDEATHEYVEWTDGQAAATSIGLRLSLWGFALREARVRPLVGVGQEGYDADLRTAVAAGAMPKATLELNHSHNELLDELAKRGVIGALTLVLFYAVPGFAFWRYLVGTGVRKRRADMRQAAALCGLVTVLGFVGFGLTQVMFAHNNGNLMYLLGISVWLAACCQRGNGRADAGFAADAARAAAPAVKDVV